MGTPKRIPGPMGTQRMGLGQMGPPKMHPGLMGTAVSHWGRLQASVQQAGVPLQLGPGALWAGLQKGCWGRGGGWGWRGQHQRGTALGEQASRLLLGPECSVGGQQGGAPVLTPVLTPYWCSWTAPWTRAVACNCMLCVLRK